MKEKKLSLEDFEKERIWNKITQKRMDCGMSIERLAVAIGITSTTLWKIENEGDLYIASATKHKICKYFNLPLRELFPCIRKGKSAWSDYYLGNAKFK